MENVLLIKVRQESQQKDFYWDLMLKLDTSSTQAVSIENYEIKFFKSDYTHILEYLCKVSFLTTLDIYKDYFKGRHKVVAIIVTCIVWPETEIALIHLSLCRSYYVFTLRVLWPRSFLIFIVDELKNFAANIFLKLMC